METQPIFEGFSYKFASKVNPDKKFELKPLNKENLEEVVMHICECFEKSDPISVYVNNQLEGLYCWIQPTTERAAEDNLGVVCYDQDTGKIAFTLVANDCYHDKIKPIKFLPAHDKNKNVRQLFGALHSVEVLDPQKFNDLTDLVTLSCGEGYQRLGLGFEVTSWTFKNHPILSQTQAVETCITHPGSKRIMEKLGWEVKNTLNIAEFKNKDGETPFADITKVTEEKLGYKDYKEIYYGVFWNNKEAKQQLDK
mmetsp:Transcript_4544/g.5016  ORF Transcript_4544/g.5016 Transcript_4544/m.5016 type:complete len:253 (-) Transcript_4544:45-803(-)|eukprot:CAMPEP_0176442490 /NCGR_PEP_ID=MMETSP0127-20121128/21847_1 /TAXON_ID=938130 /ORGANISM="Platyophrya macrostoma, Strain WH" /LENGTH=252 /DNA_ID=CAMNT_0017827515 /DNA_START=38 /DNA_END=796 /DNA_ORIENTATION=+